MKKYSLLTQTVFILLASHSLFAGAPIQRIDVVNMLWNQNGTGATPGITPTAIIVSFNNGGLKPCFTITLPFQGSTTVFAGPGQICINAITSVNFAAVAGPAGTVYSAPTPLNINGAYYSSQIIVNDATDPVFDTTNGAVQTQGTMGFVTQGQLVQN